MVFFHIEISTTVDVYVIYTRGPSLGARRTFAAEKINRAYYYYYTPDCVGMKKNNSNVLFRRNRFIIARCYFSPSVFRPQSSGFDDDFRAETYLCTYMYTISESLRDCFHSIRIVR